MKDAERTKKNIIDAAIKCFATSGYSNTSVNDIIVESDVSKGGFYNHFKSKRDLYLEIQGLWLKDIETLIREVFSTKEGKVVFNFENAFKKFQILYNKEPYRFELMVEFMYYSKSDEESRENIKNVLNSFQERLENIFKMVFEESGFKIFDAEAISFAFLSFFVGLFIRMTIFQDEDIYSNASKAIGSIADYVIMTMNNLKE